MTTILVKKQLTKTLNSPRCWSANYRFRMGSTSFESNTMFTESELGTEDESAKNAIIRAFYHNDEHRTASFRDFKKGYEVSISNA